MSVSKKTQLFENCMIIIFILLLFPFPKIVEEILLCGVFVLSFGACLSVILKKENKAKKIFFYYLPYLIFEIMLLQIHSVRFTLVAHEDGNQLLCVKVLQWLCSKLEFSGYALFSMLIYFAGILILMIYITVNGAKRLADVNDRFNTEISKVKKVDFTEDFESYTSYSFITERLKFSFISCTVICFVHLFSGIGMDMLINESNFMSAFFDNIIFTVGSGIPFIGVYSLLLLFVIICCTEGHYE